MCTSPNRNAADLAVLLSFSRKKTRGLKIIWSSKSFRGLYLCNPDQKMPSRIFWNLCKVPIDPFFQRILAVCTSISSSTCAPHQRDFYFCKINKWQSCRKHAVTDNMANIEAKGRNHLSFDFCNFDVCSTLLDWYSGLFKCGPKFIYNGSVGYIWIYLKVYMICISNVTCATTFW